MEASHLLLQHTDLLCGQPYTLKMASNIQGRRDYSVGKTWSGYLKWPARIFYYPRMYLVVIFTMHRSNHLMIC